MKHPEIIQHLIDTRINLSPLAGVSDMAFRLVCRRFGASFAFTEMVDAKAVLRATQSTFKMLHTNEEDHPLGVQLVGEDIDSIVDAAKFCEQQGFSMININAACPVPKIKRKGKGVAMMNEPLKIGRMIERLTEAVDVPIVLKIRSGYDNDSLNYLEVGQVAEKAGAAALFIHPRSAEKKYGDELNLEHIIELKQHLEIPIFASGNVLKAQDVLTMMDTTGCDGVSIARGSFGKPWIFKQVDDLWNGREMYQPSKEEIKQIVCEHFKNLLLVHEIRGAVPRMYKHMTWYFAKHKQLDPLMRTFRASVENYKDFEDFVEKF